MFVIFFEKYAKIIHFRDIIKKFFENFLKISYAKIMHFRNFLKHFFENFRSAPPTEKNPGYANVGTKDGLHSSGYRWRFIVIIGFV